MRLLSLFLAFAVSAFLAACGGGGGSAGTTPGNSTALFTTAPSTLSMNLGTAQTFTVGGGKGPYTVASSDISVAAAGITGDTLTLGAVSPGSATVTVRDSAGGTASVSVNSKLARELFTTSPSSVTVAIGNANAQSYTVGGGVGPYVVGNSNPSVLSAVLNGTTLTLTGLAPGSANVVILDNIGGSVSIAATVPSVATLDLFTTASPSITLPTSTSATYVVGGGVTPYTATSANTAVANAAIVGTTLTVTTGTSTGTTSVNVRDNAGHTVSFGVTVAAAQAFFTTAPTVVTVGKGKTASFTVGGGVTPYSTPTTSDSTVATASLSNGTLTVSGVASGTATIGLRDNSGATLSFTVNVPAPAALFTTASPGVTLANGVTVNSYTIGGGTPPYTVSSNNIGVAKASVLNDTTLSIQTLSVGSATLTIRDSANATATATVTVSPGASFFTTAPASITLKTTESPTYTVGGGVAPYTATSSNASVATANLDDATTLRITGVAPGSASVVLRDSAGTTLTVGVTVTTSSTLGLFTTAPSAVTLAVGQTTDAYSIGGGSSPYTVTSSNTNAVKVNQSGSTFTLTGQTVGSSTITIKDATGTSLTLSATVSVIPLTLNPSSGTAIVGDTLLSTITGGVGPYTATVTNPAVASANVITPGGQPTLQIVVKQQATSVPIIVTDAVGNTANFNLTSAPGQPVMQISPTDLTISTCTAVPVDMTLYGAKVGSGPLTVNFFSSDPSILTVTPANPVTATDPLHFQVQSATTPIPAGTVTITAIDSTGASASGTIHIVAPSGACP